MQSMKKKKTEIIHVTQKTGWIVKLNPKRRHHRELKYFSILEKTDYLNSCILLIYFTPVYFPTAVQCNTFYVFRTETIP